MQTAATDTITVENPDARRKPFAVHMKGETTYREPREARVTLPRVLRDDPIGQMHSRRQITDAQYLVAREYQATREAMGIGTGRSPSDLREWVDGGQIASDGITDRQMRAAKLLAAWRVRLGDAGYRLIEAVLIDKRTIRQIADASPMMSGKAATTFYGHMLRHQLDVLGKAMGRG